MIYYTQILFVKPGQETVFHAFEDHVLPLLQRYGGELVYRVRPPKPSVLVTTLDWQATLALFDGLPEASLQRMGTGSAESLRWTVAALAYHITGHELHHVNLLKKHYL